MRRRLTVFGLALLGLTAFSAGGKTPVIHAQQQRDNPLLPPAQTPTLQLNPCGPQDLPNAGQCAQFLRNFTIPQILPGQPIDFNLCTGTATAPGPLPACMPNVSTTVVSGVPTSPYVFAVRVPNLNGKVFQSGPGFLPAGLHLDPFSGRLYGVLASGADLKKLSRIQLCVTQFGGAPRNQNDLERIDLPNSGEHFNCKPLQFGRVATPHRGMSGAALGILVGVVAALAVVGEVLLKHLGTGTTTNGGGSTCTFVGVAQTFSCSTPANSAFLLCQGEVTVNIQTSVTSGEMFLETSPNQLTGAVDVTGVPGTVTVKLEENESSCPSIQTEIGAYDGGVVNITPLCVMAASIPVGCPATDRHARTRKVPVLSIPPGLLPRSLFQTPIGADPLASILRLSVAR